MYELRPFQNKLYRGILNQWGNGNKNVLAVSPTGSGKTVLFSHVIREANIPTCAIAHRQELVGQMSMALAENGIKHRVVGPVSLVKLINQLHVYKFGKSFYDPSAQVGVAGIDTLIRRGEQLKRWLPTVGLWVLDEAHHLLRDNKWGKGVSMFPNAKGLGVTATPGRADGKGLGRHHDGLIDVIVEGPYGKELIEQGFLCKYKIFAPKCDIDFSTVGISKTTGDYAKGQLAKATKKSTIIGDVVGEYIKHANGKLGVTFVPSIELAHDTATSFNAAGVPAKVVTGNTPDLERSKILKQFANREWLQLINVDLFGEGFDLPALEVVSMATKTESYSRYAQQFGRVLRIMDGKTHGIIIDHVGNIHHGLPDQPRKWTLDRRDKKSSAKDPDLIPLKACVSCTAVYEAYHKCCPYCGYQWVPEQRSTPEQVEGDLEELDLMVLAALRGEIDRIDTPDSIIRDTMLRAGAPTIVAASAAKQHRNRQTAQGELRKNIAQWAGYHRVLQRSDSEIYKRFYYQFGIDILTAQTLGKPDALKLTDKIIERMGL